MSIQEQIDKLQASITEQQAQLDALKELVAKPKKWEPPTGKFMIDPSGFNSVVVFSLDNTLSPKWVNFGLARTTREQAERDAAEIRRFARLLAYRAEFAPGYVVPPIGEKGYFIYMQKDGVCRPSWDEGRSINGYLPYEVCADLSKRINTGEVEL